MKDGDLRPLFREKFHQWQWTSVETAMTGGGVPDSEFCTREGVQGWIEFKHTKIFFVQLKPLQISWLDRRCRYGGNAWIAVRRIPSARKHDGLDELWLMRGDQARALLYDGLMGVKENAQIWSGGPKNWNYEEIGDILSLKTPIIKQVAVTP